MTLRTALFSTLLASSTLLLGCRDILITEGNSNPYEASLSISNNSDVKLLCEEAYLVDQYTKTELSNNITKAAKNICVSDFTISKLKVKTLTINPGEYYAKISAKISCLDTISSNFKTSAEQLCRSLLGQSYRSLQEQN